MLARVNQTLRPELVGRVTDKVIFGRLDFVTQRAICEAMIAAELSRLRNLGYALEVEASAIEFLIRLGYHKTLGARPMRGVVERCLQEAVTSAMLAGGNGCGRIATDIATDQLRIFGVNRVLIQPLWRKDCDSPI